MGRQPIFIAFVDAEGVQNHVDVPISGLPGDHFVHESLEVHALLGTCGFTAKGAGAHVQIGKQVDRAVPFVGAPDALNPLAAAGLNVATVRSKA